MHTQSARAADPVSSISRVVVSPAVEMLAELQALMQPPGDYPGEEEVRSLLGEAFIRELRALYRFFHGGNDFLEFVMDLSIQVEPIRLIESVRQMSNRHFLWLILGRIHPEDQLPEPESAEQIESFLKRQNNRLLYQLVGSDFGWCDRATETRLKLAELWQRYHDHRFASRELSVTQELEASAERKAHELLNLGGMELYRRVSGCDELPDQIPPDQPYTEILFVPVTYARGLSGAFFGFGTILVPFDIRKDIDAREGRERAVEELSELLKVLADPRRLRILQMIATNDYKFNGQRVADFMGLSTSVVSRHLSQLRSAGLLKEHSPDNRNIVYRVDRDALASIGPKLLDYIRDTP